MRKITAAILLSGAMFLLFGSIGVNVFFHTCHDDGQFVSYFIANEDHCGDDVQVEDECCAVDDHSSSQEHDCCDDEIKQFKVEPDYYRSAILPSFDTIIPNDYSTYSERCTYPNLTPKNYANPPPISRSERFSKHQSWLI